MPCVGFEATIPASERAKTVHVLGRSATVTGQGKLYHFNFIKQTAKCTLHFNCFFFISTLFICLELFRPRVLFVFCGLKEIRSRSVYVPNFGYQPCIMILYYSPNIIRMMKSRRMKLAGNVARMGEKRNAYSSVSQPF
jgi:hypothetical protein